MKVHLKLNTPILPLVTVLLIILQLLDPSRIWKTLLVSLGGVWMLSGLWAYYMTRSLSIQREMRYGWAQVGDKLEEQFTLFNKGNLPVTGLEIIDHSTLPGYNVSRVTSIGWQAYNQWHTSGVCTRRGLFRLGNTTIQSGDPFGIYTATIDDPGSAMLMIVPPVVPLPEIEITPGGYQGEGRPQPNAPEKTVSATSVREYVNGDSLRLVHWPTTARQGKPFVRLFDGTPAGDWWVLLDLDKNVQLGEGWQSTVELGVILAASLADRGLRARKPVGLVVNSQDLAWIPPHNAENQRWEILRALAVVEPGQNSLNTLLERVRPSLGRGASLIMITSSVSGEWLKSLIPLLRLGIRPTILLMDPVTFGSQDSAGPLVAQLKDMGVTVHLVGREMLDRPEVRPGERGQWEWRLTPTGKAIPIHMPGDTTWKRLV
jgi:uncharacterized protein (DUF58 family)